MRRVAIAFAVVLGVLCGSAHADERLAALGVTAAYIDISPLMPTEPDFERPEGALPDGFPAIGRNDIAAAWLIEPTDRYGHGVLGDAVEAGGLRAILRNGQEIEFHLGEDSVFEDLKPRLADLDGDGRDEVVVVRSYLKAGAALSVLGVRDGRLEVLAETPPIGQAHRWLNPVGVGDFDGDGKPEVAYVETPHIGGILRIVELQDGRLVEKAARRGFSNHVIGSRALALSTILDLDGDGSDDILIPAQSRMELRIVSFAGGTLRDLAAIKVKEPIQGDFYRYDLDRNGCDEILVTLESGLALVLTR